MLKESEERFVELQNKLESWENDRKCNIEADERRWEEEMRVMG